MSTPASRLGLFAPFSRMAILVALALAMALAPPEAWAGKKKAKPAPETDERAPSPKTARKDVLLIAVDAGHGKKRSGATSSRGVPEYAFNKSMAERLAAALRRQPGLDAFLVDPEGDDMGLSERPARANARGADLFVSVHHDSAQPQFFSDWTFEGKTLKYCDAFRGYSLFVSQDNPRFADSLRLAKDMGEALRAMGLAPTPHHAAKIQGENRELLDRENGVYRYDGLKVLKEARMPAVLLECGLIVNRDEETALADPARQERMAQAVAKAVARFREESGR